MESIKDSCITQEPELFRVTINVPMIHKFFTRRDFFEIVFREGLESCCKSDWKFLLFQLFLKFLFLLGLGLCLSGQVFWSGLSDLVPKSVVKSVTTFLDFFELNISQED